MASGHQGAGSLVHGGSGLAGCACVLEGNPASSPSPQWPVTFLKAVEGSVSEDLNQLSNNFIFFFATKVCIILSTFYLLLDLSQLAVLPLYHHVHSESEQLHE